MYKFKVFIEKIRCTDTESIHSSDKLFIAGAVISNEESKGFAKPLIRINTNEERNFTNEDSLLFEGISKSSSISIALQATDLDQNDGWYENKDNVLKVAGDIGGEMAGYLSSNPAVGAKTADGLKKGLAILGTVIDFFVKSDKNDTLGTFSGVIDFAAMNYGTQTKPVVINFREHDDYVNLWFTRVYVDYNDFAYEFNLRVECERYESLQTGPRHIFEYLGTRILNNEVYHSNLTVLS